MGKLVHVGKQSPPVVIQSRPDAYSLLIDTHGMAARILQGRRCACVQPTGSPNIYCKFCHGDGFATSFQRKMLRVDEDCDTAGRDGSVIKPFYVPVLEPVKVERLAADIQGGRITYQITGFDDTSIHIQGSPLPRPWEKRRCSYYWDWFNRVQQDRVIVQGRKLYTTQTRVDGQHRFGNVQEAHGDIALLQKVYNPYTGFDYTPFASFIKNQISIAPHCREPLVQGEVWADYYYSPSAPASPTVVEAREDKEQWMTMLRSGMLQIAVASWWELVPGDLITFLIVEFYREDVIVHSRNNVDKLLEFDVVRILSDEIIDQDQKKYKQGVDFELRNFHDIYWLGKRQPQIGSAFSVRFAYRPTYIVFKEVPIPNRSENKVYPLTFNAQLYSKTMQREHDTVAPQNQSAQVFVWPPKSLGVGEESPWNFSDDAPGGMSE